MKTLLILLLLSTTAHATEWLCTEEASQREGANILACGIGTGSDENTARLNAFDSAKAEFTKVCSGSDDCNNKQVSILPKRTSCEQTTNGSYKCYRLVTFNIGSGISIINTTTYADSPDSFKPFIYDKSVTQVKVGMLKAQVLQIFGLPYAIDTVSPGRFSLHYSGAKICQPNQDYCWVSFMNGRVQSTEGIKLILTDALM